MNAVGAANSRRMGVTGTGPEAAAVMVTRSSMQLPRTFATTALHSVRLCSDQAVMTVQMSAVM
jgi:hypothetical protein